MTALINMPRAAWNRQPSSVSGVNWNNPYTQGLVTLALFNTIQPRNEVNQEFLGMIGSGTKTLAATPKGLGLQFGLPAGTTYYSAPVKTETADAMSLLWMGQTSGSAVPVVRDFTTVSGEGTFLMRNSNGTLYFRAFGYNAYSSSVGSWGTGLKTFMLSTSPGDRVYIGDESGWRSNYEKIGTQSPVTPWVLHRNGAAASGINAASLLLAIWNRSVDLSLIANPWQLFTPAHSRFYLIPSSGGVITLIVQNASHSHSVDAPSLTQAHVLALADSLHGHAVESPILSQAYVLSLAAAAHAHNADNLSLSQAQSIAVADTAHSHSVDSMALTQAYILALADTAHAHSAESPTLSTGLSLSLADTAHSQTADIPTLIQAYILNLSDAAHSHAAGSVSMGQGYTLTVADTAHSHTADAPTVTVAFVLAVQDALHSQAADALALATQVTLVVSDALHAHLAGSASEITLPTGDRIFLVSNEDRLFLVATEDRLFGV